MTETLLKTLEKQWKNMTGGDFKSLEKHHKNSEEKTRTKLKKKDLAWSKNENKINKEKQRAIDGSTDNTVRLKKARKTTVEMQTNEQKHGRNMGTEL